MPAILASSGRHVNGPPDRGAARMFATLTSDANKSSDRHGPLTPSELAAHERVRRPSITRVLARLEELGLIDRAPDPADRRSSLITASAEGRTLLRRQRSRKDQ